MSEGDVTFYSRIQRRLGCCMMFSCFWSTRLALFFYGLAVVAEQLRQYHLRQRLSVPLDAIGQTCAVCMRSEGKGVRLHCGHAFHDACISKWADTLMRNYKRELTCPVCRSVSQLHTRCRT